MTAVTSDQLLKFIEKATTVEITLDANGEEIGRKDASLAGEPLANALRVVSELAAHESGIAFARHQFDTAHPPSLGGSVIDFPGPRAN